MRATLANILLLGSLARATVLGNEQPDAQPRRRDHEQSQPGPDYDKARAAGFERMLVKPVAQEKLGRILDVSKTAA